MKQLTKQQAIEFYNSETWKDWSDEDVARFQLFQDKLCIPMDDFHRGIEKLLNRPVWTHEFANAERLRQEYLTQRPAPTMQEIIEMIPADKRVVIGL